MKIKKITELVAEGPFASSPDLIKLKEEILESIQSVVWPPENDTFIVNPERKGNGVKPIKKACMRSLLNKGWTLEKRMKILALAKPGPVDAIRHSLRGSLPFVLEWETGNISSSHRALNKIAVGMLEGCIIGGCLILPSRELYKYLTDRVGNYQELEPYFPLWNSLKAHIRDGVLLVIEVEFDLTSDHVPKIPKGTDGWALVKKPT